MIFKLYVKNKEGEFINLPTFEDEGVEYEAKISDTEELDSIYNDTTRDFSVPATDQSNNLFKYWFEIGYSGSNPFDINETFEALIELNTIPYKFGEIKLIGYTSKEGKPYSYKLSFTGNLTQLDKTFGKDKLADLNFDHLRFNYTSDNIVDLIEKPYNFISLDGTGYPRSIMIPPMFATDKNLRYSYTYSNLDNDITDNYILSDENVKPAISASEIIEAIERKYDIIFDQGIDNSIFDSSTFKNLYMWLNGEEETSYDWRKVNFGDLIPNTAYPPPVYPPEIEQEAASIDENGDFRIRFNYDIFKEKLPNNNLFQWEYKLSVAVSNPTEGEYKIRIVDTKNNETVDETTEWTTEETLIPRVISLDRTFYAYGEIESIEQFTEIDKTFKVEVIKKGDFPLTVFPNIRTRYIGSNELPHLVDLVSPAVTLNEFPPIFNVSKNIPDMEVSEFFKGVLKAFKLVIIPVQEGKFKVMPLNTYYRKGNTVNLTPFLGLENVETIARESYKNIDFKFEETDLVIQKAFREIVSQDGQGYGDLSLEYPKLKEEKEIELPFNTFLPSDISYEEEGYSRIPLIVGLQQTVDDEGVIKSAGDKGVFLFYYNGQQKFRTIGNYEFKKIKFTSLGEQVELERIPKISPANTVISTEEEEGEPWPSPYHLDALTFNERKDPNINLPSYENNLYSRYWKDWVDTLYYKDSRIVNYKGYIDYHTLEKLELNSKVIIGNNLYNINDFKVNLIDYKFDINLFPNIDYKLKNNYPTRYIEDMPYKDIEFSGFYSFTDRVDLKEIGDYKVELYDNSSLDNWVTLEGKGEDIEGGKIYRNIKDFSYSITGVSANVPLRTIKIRVTNLEDNNEIIFTVKQRKREDI